MCPLESRHWLQNMAWLNKDNLNYFYAITNMLGHLSSIKSYCFCLVYYENLIFINIKKLNSNIYQNTC